MKSDTGPGSGAPGSEAAGRDITGSIPAAPLRPGATPVSTLYPADVLRVMDGDTFEARVHLWPGLENTTRIRLRGVDAPELHARCSEERRKAEAARDALSGLLNQGQVRVWNVGFGKYAGRVLASVATAQTTDLADALLSRGLVRSYDGGLRAGWCNGSVG